MTSRKKLQKIRNKFVNSLKNTYKKGCANIIKSRDLIFKCETPLNFLIFERVITTLSIMGITNKALPYQIQILLLLHSLK